MNMTIDLDDLFNDIYYMDLPGAPPAPPLDEREELLLPVEPVSSSGAPQSSRAGVSIRSLATSTDLSCN